jgi:hypothetical protein
MLSHSAPNVQWMFHAGRNVTRTFHQGTLFGTLNKLRKRMVLATKKGLYFRQMKLECIFLNCLLNYANKRTECKNFEIINLYTVKILFPDLGKIIFLIMYKILNVICNNLCQNI